MKLVGLALGILLVLLAALEVITARAARGDSASPPMRFDNVVRDDFFAGLRGDAARLDRAMKRCEEELAKDPRHAQALVWHGSGLAFRAGEAARRGDTTAAVELSTRGLREMDEAVALAPRDTVVLLLRGVTLSAASRGLRDPARATAALRTAVGDYETTLEIQKEIFPRLSTHARGELLGALAESWQRLGDDTRSRAYLTRIVAEVPFSPYAETAAYLGIEQARFGDRFRCTIELGDGLESCEVPPLALHTVVQNSVKHVAAAHSGPAEIRIRGEAQDGRLRLGVWDAGGWFPLDAVPPGHGLDTLRSRLDVLYRGEGRLDVERVDGARSSRSRCRSDAPADP